ncbi:MAG: type II toxin-antitoxin system RelE/ParE family toxin [Chloroflexi bacterium]|nr:type II toxin-antitoxin system RelE/ParE family toxin [Chloroflexota bacterium]MCY3937873.1 type II toxin-antitoxin system RelE/ParE family toxin [Chloroflexota bacterium]
MGTSLKYSIVVLPSAVRALRRIPRRELRRISEKVDLLAIDPRPPDARVIHRQKGLLRLRVGDYRVLYRVRDDIVEITVVRIAHRKDAYRNLRRLAQRLD